MLMPVGSGTPDSSVASSAQAVAKTTRQVSPATTARAAAEAGLDAVTSREADDLLRDVETFLALETDRESALAISLLLLAISLTEKVTADVLIQLEGEPVGVRLNGGIIETLRNSVEIEALPQGIPSAISLIPSMES